MLVSSLKLSGYLLYYLVLRYTLLVFSVSMWFQLVFLLSRLVRRIFLSLIDLSSTGSTTSAAFIGETPHVVKTTNLIFGFMLNKTLTAKRSDLQRTLSSCVSSQNILSLIKSLDRLREQSLNLTAKCILLKLFKTIQKLRVDKPKIMSNIEDDIDKLRKKELFVR